MTYLGWILLLACSVFMACATFMLRLSIDNAGGFFFTLRSFIHLATQPLFLLGTLAYALSMLGWFKIIATESLSVAYPLMITMTFVLVSLGSVIILKEPLGATKVLGLGLIIAGIVFVSR